MELRRDTVWWDVPIVSVVSVDPAFPWSQQVDFLPLVSKEGFPLLVSAGKWGTELPLLLSCPYASCFSQATMYSPAGTGLAFWGPLPSEETAPLAWWKAVGSGAGCRALHFPQHC